MAGPTPNFGALTGGRALRREPDLIDQKESFERRQKEQAPRDGWLLCPVDASTPLDAMLFAAANTAYFIPFPRLDRTYTITHARINVNVNIAASHVDSALYVYERRTNYTRLVQVPGTQVRFATTAAGPVTVVLTAEVEIGPATILFLGARTNDATVGVAGVNASATKRQLVRMNSIAATSMPSEVNLAATAKGAGTPFPVILYLSREAAEIL